MIFSKDLILDDLYLKRNFLLKALRGELGIGINGPL